MTCLLIDGKEHFSQKSPRGFARSDSLEDLSGQFKDKYDKFKGNCTLIVQNNLNYIYRKISIT